MKVKLLKKLRKRFVWSRDVMRHCWLVYDRLEIREEYIFIAGFHYVNDMALYHMMCKIGLQDIFRRLQSRLDIKSQTKREKALLEKYK